MSSQISKFFNKYKLTPRKATPKSVKLPDNVLFLILHHLDHAGKLNCTLMCKKWNAIISASPNFLNSTKLRLDTPSKPFKSFNFCITRSYRDIAICLERFAGSDNQISKLLSCIAAIAENIERLQLANIPGRFDIEILQILAQCKSLTVLTLFDIDENSRLTEGEYPQRKSIKLPHLSVLRTHETCDWICKFIDCTELDSLRIIYALGQHTVDFINNLTRLDTLILSPFCVNSQLCYQLEIAPKFKWRQLMIDNCSHGSDCIDGSCKSLENLAKSAGPKSRLELKKCRNYPKRLASMVMAAGNVEELIVDVEGIDLEFISRLKRELVIIEAEPRKNYRKLNLRDTKVRKSSEQAFLRPGWLDWLWRLLPHIEILTVTGNLMLAFDAETVPTLLGHVMSLGVMDRITKVEMEKLQTLKLPEMKEFIFACSDVDRKLRSSCLKKIADINSSLKMIYTDDPRGFKGYKVSSAGEILGLE